MRKSLKGVGDINFSTRSRIGGMFGLGSNPIGKSSNMS